MFAKLPSDWMTLGLLVSMHLMDKSDEGTSEVQSAFANEDDLKEFLFMRTKYSC